MFYKWNEYILFSLLRVSNCSRKIFLYTFSTCSSWCFTYFNPAFVTCVLLLLDPFFLFFYSFRFWQAFGLSGTISPPWRMYSVHPRSKSSHISILVSVCEWLHAFLGNLHVDCLLFRNVFKCYNSRCQHASLGGANASTICIILCLMKEVKPSADSHVQIYLCCGCKHWFEAALSDILFYLLLEEGLT